ncbi:MAG: Leucyl aminopeptidase [Actinomycetia bacterium]|nr:Leucyl aminopeptidase [Actinomycetes bacterium]
MTTLSLSDSPATTLAVDALVIGVHADDGRAVPGPGAAEVDAALGGKLAAILASLGASGSAGEITKIATLGATTAPVVVAAGLGKPEKAADPEAVRQAAGAALRALAGSAKVALSLGSGSPGSGNGLLRAAAEGALLGTYQFVTYKSDLGKSYKAPVAAITLIVPDAKDKAAKAEVKRASALIAAVQQTRDWVNTPPNDLRPPAFADQAGTAATKAGLEVEILDEKALRKGGYGGILAVGTGSAAAPRLVQIRYRPAGAKKHIALVGKGITFDTGGISIKPAQGMADMKSDMAGAAAVISVMLAVAALKPKVAVSAYVPMAENMPSGSAYRPGDVVTMYGGKKVEVLNTDAEGRMILGDALARACEDSPDYLIDTATLTGGQVVALGHRISGVMGTSDGLLGRVKDAGQRVGEPMWLMPIPDEVRAGMDSAIADVMQIVAGFDRGGHMLQGGAFLREFVGEGVEWAHIDIAGPSYNTSAPYGYIGKGGTGVPIRTLIELIEDIASNG